MNEGNKHRRLSEDEAYENYQQMVDEIEKEILRIISQYGADETIKKSNAGHIANLAERVINHPIPDTSKDRIYWHLRSKVAHALSGGVSNERYRYTDTRLITASGGYETDYVIALFADSGTPLAMKYLKPDATALAKKAFNNEQTVLSRLYFTFKSTYPVTLLKLFAIGDGVTVTERVEGGNNLQNELTKVKDVKTIIEWFRDICDGLEKLYSAGYERHGDVSAKNCILGGDGRVRVGDFSLASDETAYQYGKTISPGNPYFLAPEVILSYKTNGIKPIIDKRSDIYSLGVLLYMVLTKGKDPFGREDEKIIQKSKDFGINPAESLLLGAYAKTIKASNYSIQFFLQSGHVASRSLVNSFAEDFFHTRVVYPVNQFGFDTETAQALDSFLAKCLSFGIEVRPKNPEDFFRKLAVILERYID